VVLLAGLSGPATADVKSRAIRETAEYMLRVFGKDAAREGAETLAGKLEVLVARHGEEVLVAVRKIGPRALPLVEEAGAHAPQAIKLMARLGDEAVWIVSRPRGLALFVKHGEEGAAPLLRHKGIAEPLIEAHARPAVQALNAINPPNGRRLAMLAESGELAQIGRTPELLGVVGKYGDRAMEFLWKHKGALVMSAALAVFLADPEPFLDGAVDILKVTSQAVVPPMTEAVGQAGVEVVRAISWDRMFLLLGVGITGGLVLRQLIRWLAGRRRNERRAEPGS
jgi:hypothetical protein